MSLRRSAAGLVALFLYGVAVSAAELTPQQQRGRVVYGMACLACHQFSGQGVRGVYPPLAGSDYLMADRERSIAITIQGHSGRITVNGVDYNGVMPAPPIANDDQKVADVLTYIRGAWGNNGDAISAEEVKAVRAKLASAAAKQPDPFAPLPTPPKGFKIREVVKLPAHGVRLATMPGTPWIFVLNNGGDLYRLEPASGDLTRVLSMKDYAPEGGIDAYGMTIDSRKRLYLVTNRRTPGQPFQTNFVTIYRSAPLTTNGLPAEVKPWLKAAYPYGVGPYNHGVGHIAEGPDGMLYVTSGSRTDGGEPGTDPNLWKGGETPLTAGIWRLDPKSESPEIEMFARGIRNAWSFAWNDKKELFSASNGPDADMAEEMDFVQQGKHYGFPYQFADSTEKPYPHTPDAPPGVTFTHAIRSVGPAAGGSKEKPIATFDAHSSPAGMVYCGKDWPRALRGKFLVGRFGNLIKERDVGYDVLSVALKKNAAGIYEAQVETFLAPLGRPMDLLQIGKNLYVLEYTRPTANTPGRPMNPGRILELAW